MSHSTDRTHADRNLLFGILALQINFINRDALVAGMHAWVLDKTRSLGQILLELGHLTAGELRALDTLIAEHVHLHGNDPRRSLNRVSTVSQARRLLAPVADADVQASLASTGTPETEDTRDLPGAPDAACRYRKLRPHARGGLGEVFLAQDIELHREVALKEIQVHRADDPASRGRFILEAEITGGLEHPGIVPVYGFGIHANGRPFYAMRFIRGRSLKEAIERFHADDKPGRDPGERSLAYRQLLRRFIDSCNAVAYAHSRGVLHRDLKPANIMLGKYGETLVVDWGLAKAGLGSSHPGNGDDDPSAEAALQPQSDSDLLGTRAGSVLGTPPYMSPEQAAGRLDELGPGSDIYSLGATLYVLLTGKKPFDGPHVEEVLARVRAGTFPAPRQIRPDTPGALNAICRRAMANKPADRYPNALDLAADVEHWLADEPVAAFPDPPMVRLARWTRRHRTTVVAAGVFLASAVVALSVSTALVWAEQRKTQAQKHLAEQNFQLARDLSFNGIDLMESSEVDFAAVPSLHAARKELLQAASRACGQFLEQEPADRELRQRTAQVYRYTANVQRQTNEDESAGRLFRDAVRLQEGLMEQYPEESSHRQKLAETLRDFGSLQAKAGRVQEAAATFSRSLELAKMLREEDPDRPAYRRAVGTTLLDLSGVQYTRGLFAESAENADRAVELFRQLLRLAPGTGRPYDPLLLAAALNRLALAERETGRLADARAAHAEAVKNLHALLDKRPERVNLADILQSLARYRLEQCRTWARTPERRASAETNLGVAILQWEALAKKYPALSTYRKWLGIACQVRGQLRADAHRLDEARADLDRSRQLLEALVQESPELPFNRAELGRTYAALGRLTSLAGDSDAAAAWFEKATAALRQAVNQCPDDVHNRRSLREVQAEQLPK